MNSSDADGGRVFVKVAADLIHPGHLRFFRAARSLGSHLTVGVVPDERIIDYKGAPLLFTHEERLEMVASLRWVDAVDPDPPRQITLDFLDSRGYDIYAFGAADDRELSSRLSDAPNVPASRMQQLPYTAGYSSRALRGRLREASRSDSEALEREAE